MKEFLEYLFGQLKAERPVTREVNGVHYAVKGDGTLGEPVRELAPQWTAPTLAVSTLSGLVDAYNARLDGFPDKVGLHIVDYLTVELLSLVADNFGRRHVWVQAKHVPDTPFRFGTYMTPENFLIAFRASFYFDDNALKVQQLCSTVESGDAVLVADDGISQEVTVKSGSVTKSSIQLPPEGVSLIPWRTFRDAWPVVSKFLLRMKGVKDSLPMIALFEIDAKWKLDVMQAIRDWLSAALPDATIIA